MVLVVVAPLSSCLPLSLSSVLNPPCVAGFAQGVWSTPPYNEKKLNKAYRVCDAPHMHTASHHTPAPTTHYTHCTRIPHTNHTYTTHTPTLTYTTCTQTYTHAQTTHMHAQTYMYVLACASTHHTVAHTTPWHTPTHAV